MSLKRMLLATGAAFALITPEPVAAQSVSHFSNFDQYSQTPARYRQVCPAPHARSAQNRRTTASHNQNKTVQGSANVVMTRATEPPPAMTKTVEPPAPPPPLTEEQIAAKAAVDELLAREPALWAAKDRPDPALAKAAAEKHRQQELQKAKLQAQQEAAVARRQAIAEKPRAREEKVAALKARHAAGTKSARNRAAADRSAPAARRVATASVSRAPARRPPMQPLPRWMTGR
jgi:hypothetical protein